jgi:hypothetical protein
VSAKARRRPIRRHEEEDRPRWDVRTSNPGRAVRRSLVGSTPILLRYSAMLMRYTVRNQGDGYYCVWDNETDEAAEAHGMRYINLSREKAFDEAQDLNDEQ